MLPSLARIVAETLAEKIQIVQYFNCTAMHAIQQDNHVYLLLEHDAAILYTFGDKISCISEVYAR